MLTVRSSFLICLSVFGFACSILFQHESLALICLSILLLVWLQWLSFASMQRTNRKFRDSFVRLIDNQSDARVTLVTDRTYEVELRFDLSKLRSGYRITLQDGVARRLRHLWFVSGCIRFASRRISAFDGII